MSGQNFIGSKISLTSNSDIRYEGTLHSLNTEESTVALEQVRSFGTEGRRGNPEEEIPPSENVFEFVVFRGSDIKDLKIFEPPAKPAPPPPPPANMPNDPAIMNSVMKGYGANAGMNPYMMPPYPPMQQQQQHPQQYWGSPMYGMPPPGPMGGAPNPAMQQQQQQQQHQQQQQPSRTQAPLGNRGIPGMPTEHQQQPSAPIAPGLTGVREEPVIAEKPNNEIESLSKDQGQHVSTEIAVKALEDGLDNLEIVKDEKEDDQQRGHHHHQQQQQQHQQQHNRQRRYNNNNNNYNAGGRTGQRHYNNNNNNTINNNKQPIEIPKSDFDFESSNAKFKKDDLLKEVTKKTGDEEEEQSVDETTSNVDDNNANTSNNAANNDDTQEDEEVVIPPSDESFYDKDKSFFDNISCESKERSEQDQNGIDRRAKFHEERKLNLETFGEASVDRPRYRGFRGRGGYRGRGNGGYQRGGRYGFRGNNNRGVSYNA